MLVFHVRSSVLFFDLSAPGLPMDEQADCPRALVLADKSGLRRLPVRLVKGVFELLVQSRFFFRRQFLVLFEPIPQLVRFGEGGNGDVDQNDNRLCLHKFVLFLPLLVLDVSNRLMTYCFSLV